MEASRMKTLIDATDAEDSGIHSVSIGLALSGGGVEGFAHIGAYQALSEIGAHVDVVAGTSSGSIIAALAALGCTPEEMFDAMRLIYHGVKSISISRLVRAVIGFIRHGKTGVDGLIDTSVIERIIDKVACSKGIDRLVDVPRAVLALVAVDTIRVREIAFCSQLPAAPGPFDVFQDVGLGRAVRASMAFPGLFQPVTVGPYDCIDGGTVDNLPTRVVQAFGVDRIIAVDFDTEHYAPAGNLEETALRALDVYSHDDVLRAERMADIVVTIDNGDTNIWKIDDLERTVRNGYDAVMARRNDIVSMLMNDKVVCE